MSTTSKCQAADRLHRLQLVADNWRDIQLQTSPIDRQAAIKAMSRLHEKVWGKPPVKVHCFDSPLAASIAQEIISTAKAERQALFVDSEPYDEVQVTARPISFDRRLRELIAEVFLIIHDAIVKSYELNQAGNNNGALADMALRRVYQSRRFDERPLGLEHHLNLFHGGWTSIDVFSPELRKLVGEEPLSGVETIRQQVCLQLGVEPDQPKHMDEVELLGIYQKLWRLELSDELWLRRAVNDFVHFFQIARKYGLVLEEEPLDWFDVLFQVAATCGFGLWSTGDTAAIVERPVFISLDDEQRLHNETGPAMVWRDGYRVFSWKGVNVPPWVIEHKDNISLESIVLIENAPIRRAMIEIMGKEKFARQSGAKIISSDETGNLWRLEFDQIVKSDPDIYRLPRAHWFSARNWPEEDVWQAVEVKNATPEPDGSYRTYFLEVPPDMQSAREAVAWSFGMSAEDYWPDLES